jgi:hypothetical protein
MNGVPPIITPPVMPPPLPAAVTGESLEKYISRCEVICLVAATLFLAGVIGFWIQYAEGGAANWGAFGFAVWYVLMGYGAAALLHRRRREAYLATVPCLIILLVVIPVGTVFGILGLNWLNKGQSLLRNA